MRVRDGIVTLTGQIENEDTARDAVRLTRDLDGVVDVVDKLHAKPEGPRPVARGG